MPSVFHKVEHGAHALLDGEKHSHSHIDYVCDKLHDEQQVSNRFHSFAPATRGDVKWYVDGCSYFWAVSEAIEKAQESIYILDWWLSPEIYLRRPPSKNQQYRLDTMLKAAAERGVQVKVIVYKEVQAALSLDSAHTKHALEALHPNIKVFRHPDHVPTSYNIEDDLNKTIDSLSHFNLAQASSEAVEAVYGVAKDVVLFWAHHEKLMIVDRDMGFMGGLDLCFGRWDTNSHPIADAHPGDLDEILFPGQDYNNARVFDFSDVRDWRQNKIDRTRSSRMGWSDMGLNMKGPIVEDLVTHFVDRWNFIYDEKYEEKDPKKYQALTQQGAEKGARQKLKDTYHHYFDGLTGRGQETEQNQNGEDQKKGAQQMQLTRSCTKWSSGHRTEHSVANAYMDAIRDADHFIYIENQFFITATGEQQHPVMNKIGASIVERIVRAHQNNQKFKIRVVIPAVPAFAGDLKSDAALGTRGIMQFQYNSICRGGHSILEKLREAGIDDPDRYISFYNLRNYDRINTSKTMGDAEESAGVSYEEARKQHDDQVGASSEASPDEKGRAGGQAQGRHMDKYDGYQRAAGHVQDNTLDTVSPCYMDGGPSLQSVPWEGPAEDEMDSFVSEELYIHTKLLIADDRLVIAGSANLNDRSQLGTHDSEIAVVIEEDASAMMDSHMDGQPYRVSPFAASLRRHISRKHLGLLPDQRWDEPTSNWLPVSASPNDYDWGSPADVLVQDPLTRNFDNLWDGTAETNTEVFRRAFHAVPDDGVRTWDDYDAFFSKHFVIPSVNEEQDEEKLESNEDKVLYGHIVRGEFEGGVREVREWLGRVRGSLVKMPLAFLADEGDIAHAGLKFNGLTDEIYT